jgi:hypothetical protein
MARKIISEPRGQNLDLYVEVGIIIFFTISQMSMP